MLEHERNHKLREVEGAHAVLVMSVRGVRRKNEDEHVEVNPGLHFGRLEFEEWLHDKGSIGVEAGHLGGPR